MGAINYQQTVKYEVASDLLNGRIAELSEQIGQEEGRATPDPAVIERLEAKMDSITDELGKLDVTNEAALDAVIAANSREAARH